MLELTTSTIWFGPTAMSGSGGSHPVAEIPGKRALLARLILGSERTPPDIKLFGIPTGTRKPISWFFSTWMVRGDMSICGLNVLKSIVTPFTDFPAAIVCVWANDDALSATTATVARNIFEIFFMRRNLARTAIVAGFLTWNDKKRAPFYRSPFFIVFRRLDRRFVRTGYRELVDRKDVVLRCIRSSWGNVPRHDSY